jgi:hypothetical protein
MFYNGLRFLLWPQEAAMSTSASIRKVLSFLAWAITLLCAVFLPKLLNYAWWSILVGIAPSLVRLAYEHFDNINLFTNRVFLWITNKEVAWEMTAHFVGYISNLDLDDFIQSMHTKLPSMKLLHQSDLERTLSIPDIGVVVKVFVATVQSEISDANVELVMAFQRAFVPFRHSTIILNQLITMINDVRKIREFESERYDFSVLFTDSNPF